MIVVAVVGILAGVGTTVVMQAKERSREIKLESDVATLNRAIQTYQASGGSLEDTASAEEVLAQLKTAAKGDTAKQLVGFRGMLVDDRLSPVVVKGGGGKPLAVWNAEDKRFVVKQADSGIERFNLSAAPVLEPKEDKRQTVQKFSKDSGWVWDHTAVASGGNTVPSNIPSEADTTPGDAPSYEAPPPPASAKKLLPPSFSIKGEYYPLIEYPLTVTITNPNPADSSILRVISKDGTVSEYPKGGVTVDPNLVLTAMAVSIDTDQYTDSDPVSEEYTTKPVALDFELSFAKEKYTYAEAGGKFMAASGSTKPKPSSPKAETGTLKLKNADDIPKSYLSSDYFTAAWTGDGSDPLEAKNTARTVVPESGFSGGFPDQQIPLRLEDWGNEVTYVVKAGGTPSASTQWLEKSPVETKTLSIAKTVLHPPLITYKESNEYGQLMVTLNFDLASGLIPENARIFYTLDGSEPAEKNGLPISGELYTGPIALDTVTNSRTITARIFPPEEYSEWFTPSTAGFQKFNQMPQADVYLGGRFAKLNGSGRNIARLGNDGGLDPTFNVGQGATPGSTVAVVYRESDSSLYVGGNFSGINNQGGKALVKLNRDGSVDHSFSKNLQLQ